MLPLPTASDLEEEHTQGQLSVMLHHDTREDRFSEVYVETKWKYSKRTPHEANRQQHKQESITVNSQQTKPHFFKVLKSISVASLIYKYIDRTDRTDRTIKHNFHYN